MSFLRKHKCKTYFAAIKQRKEAGFTEYQDSNPSNDSHLGDTKTKQAHPGGHLQNRQWQ